MAFIAAYQGLINFFGIVDDLINIFSQVSLGRESITLNFLEIERKCLSDVFNFMQADQITEICGGIKEMVEGYPRTYPGKYKD